MVDRPEDMTAEERAARAMELRLAGATYDGIAKTLGYSSKGVAHGAVQRALREVNPPGEEATKLTELARLDAMLTGLWPKARRGDVTAVDRVLRIEERREAIVSGNAHKHEDETGSDGPATGLSNFEERLREREKRLNRGA